MSTLKAPKSIIRGGVTLSLALLISGSALALPAHAVEQTTAPAVTEEQTVAPAAFNANTQFAYTNLSAVIGQPLSFTLHVSDVEDFYDPTTDGVATVHVETVPSFVKDANGNISSSKYTVGTFDIGISNGTTDYVSPAPLEFSGDYVLRIVQGDFTTKVPFTVNGAPAEGPAPEENLIGDPEPTDPPAPPPAPPVPTPAPEPAPVQRDPSKCENNFETNSFCTRTGNQHQKPAPEEKLVEEKVVIQPLIDTGFNNDGPSNTGALLGGSLLVGSVLIGLGTFYANKRGSVKK